MSEYDVFISHASEDKEEYVRELAAKLQSEGIRVWYDEFTLKVGDSLPERIDYGLANSRFGIVVLSPNFFEKGWPRRELDALQILSASGECKLLPIWKDIDAAGVRRFSPLLGAVVAIKAYEGIDQNASDLISVIDPANSFPERRVELELESASEFVHEGFDVRVSWSPDMKLMNANNSFYDPKKVYVNITVGNWGVREVVIAKAGLHTTTGDHPFMISADSMLFGPRRLKDGDAADYLIEQDTIEDLGSVDYAWAVDQVGRQWRSDLK